jgi:hypothetical protein
MTSDDIWIKFLRVANWGVLITALSILSTIVFLPFFVLKNYIKFT